MLLQVLVVPSAVARPSDRSVEKRIQEAVNKYYLATNFAKAEKIITAEINACGRRCRPRVIAKAWMYVGIIRGSGKNDQKGARKAFVTAVGYDPNVVLDEGLATSATKKTFDAVKRTGGGESQPTAGLGDLDEGAAKMECSLQVSEVQTRRPIPIECTTVSAATKVELHYKFRGTKWKRIRMKRRRGAFQGTIPCTAIPRAGVLSFYVSAQDSEGDPVDSFAKKGEPVQLEAVRATDEESPSLPGKKAPPRCSKSASEEGEEEEEEGQSCDVSEDCPNGDKCIDGTCHASKRSGAAGGPVSENYVGLHFAYDFAIVGGTEVCSQASQRDNGFVCFYEDSEEQYLFNTQPNVSNNINTGLAPATSRVLLSFDHVLADDLTAGGRLGYAFGGGPPSGEDKAVKFLPFHVELRASYWFGDKPFTKEGFRPYIGASGGLAQVDAKLPVTVGDCGGEPDGSAASSPGAKAVRDSAFSAACTSDQLVAGQRAARLKLDAYKKLGKGFVGLHGGVVYALTKNSGIQINLNFLYFLPTTGEVIEPSIGYVFGL